MSDTALDHPLIRAYLRELDGALASLPPQRAAELRDQIAEQLDEELPANPTDDDVADAIRRMGTPADLARDAGARPTLRSALRRRSWKFWASTGAVIAIAGVLIGLFVSIETAPVLYFDGSAGWWYPQDWKHEVDTEAGPSQQTMVLIRQHQRQGFFVQIFNNSGYTQTVLGYAPGSAESPGSDVAQLGISTGADRHYYPGDPTTQHYALPVSIPPGHSRYLRVLWTADICMSKGASQSIDQLTLRVRIGWITRTETINLLQSWAVEGTAQSSCDT